MMNPPPSRWATVGRSPSSAIATSVATSGVMQVNSAARDGTQALHRPAPQDVGRDQREQRRVGQPAPRAPV